MFKTWKNIFLFISVYFCRTPPHHPPSSFINTGHLCRPSWLFGLICHWRVWFPSFICRCSICLLPCRHLLQSRAYLDIPLFHRNLVKITIPLASVGSEHGMKIYKKRVTITGKESRKLAVRRGNRNNYEGRRQYSKIKGRYSIYDVKEERSSVF